MNLDEIKEQVRQEIDNDILGHDGKDGTYIYCLTRVKEAFHYGTMTLDDWVEVDEEFTDQFVELFAKHYAPLVSQLEEAQKTLEWYADPETYDIEHLNKHGYIIIDRDGGERARDTLKRLRGEQP